MAGWMGESEVGASDSRFTSSSKPRVCVVGGEPQANAAVRVMAVADTAIAAPRTVTYTASHLRELDSGESGISCEYDNESDGSWTLCK
jgi:hypothetical protein